MHHAKLINRLVPLWLVCYAGLAMAAPSFAQDMKTLDVESVVWAGAAGMLGGALRTILTLASTRSAVYNIAQEAFKDMVVALLAGLAAYVVVQGTGAVMTTYWSMSPIPRDLRLLVIIGAGWTRLGFFGRLDRLTKSAISRVERQINGGQEQPPSSETMPLEERNG
jgi:hypothetical protein